MVAPVNHYIQYVNAYCLDRCLVKVANPVFLVHSQTLKFKPEFVDVDANLQECRSQGLLTARHCSEAYRQPRPCLDSGLLLLEVVRRKTGASPLPRQPEAYQFIMISFLYITAIVRESERGQLTWRVVRMYITLPQLPPCCGSAR
jgi:hypothetical protein